MVKKILELADMRFVEILGLRAAPYALQGDPLNLRKDRFFQLQMRSDRNRIRRHQYMYGSESDCCSSPRLHQYGARLVMIV